MPSVICPTCKGKVTTTKRGQKPEEALEKHQHLAHGIQPPPPPPRRFTRKPR